ncbi:MAG: metallophosphoesterase [Oscillospiraceae bacterium]
MVYITGDTHGVMERFLSPPAKALKKGDTLIICGDFGFIWDDSKRERKILNQLGKKKYNICFLDGTHENFDLLNEYEISEWNGGKVQHITGSVYHLMRGQIYEIEGLKIFTMGGGESPDIDMRFDNDAWSRNEIPTQVELLNGANNIEQAGCKVDVIVTHEPPSKIKGFLMLKSNERTRVTALNAYFEQLSASCEFNKWYFGSMHMDKHISSTHIAVFNNIVEVESGKKVNK